MEVPTSEIVRRGNKVLCSARNLCLGLPDPIVLGPGSELRSEGPLPTASIPALLSTRSLSLAGLGGHRVPGVVCNSL